MYCDDLLNNLILVYSDDIKNSKEGALSLYNALEKKNISSSVVPINNLSKDASFVIVMGRF